jgi:2-(3-amino-3-carboxypropyl)histidine synthase
MEQRAYEFELERIKALIKERVAYRVGLQLPEGLKTVAIALAAEISKETGAEVIVSGSSCYGACDIDEKLEHLVDVLFHFGHADTFLSRDHEKVVFIELRSTVDVKPVVERAVAALTGTCVGLAATVQHAHVLEEAKQVLTRAGKATAIGKNLHIGAVPGRILGCEFSAARVSCDEILFVGSGGFHPTGIALYTGKRVVAADPFTQRISVFEPDELRKKRYLVLGRALDAKSFGILISTKSGQLKLNEASALKHKAEKKGLEAYLIALDEINEARLLGYNVDAFVNTACPRLVEDFVQFKNPVLAVNEFEVLLGERTWDELWQ